MEKVARAEIIAELVTNKYSGFKDGDEAILEAASDARLEDFRTAAESRRVDAANAAKQETETRNIAARLKVAEDRIKAAEAELSEDEFLQRAPATIKSVIDEHRAAEAATRASLVTQLKDLGEISEDDLKKKTLGELKTLASYARVTVPDFSVRGLPVERNAGSKHNYAPPNPYEAGIKALQAKL